MVQKNVESIEKLTPKAYEIHTRKSKILRLRSLGHTEEDIAERLGVSPKTVSRDIKELKNESIEWLNNLPDGEIQLILKKSFENIYRVISLLKKIYNQTNDVRIQIRVLDQIAQKYKMISDMMDKKDLLKLRIRLDDILHPSSSKIFFLKSRPIIFQKNQKSDIFYE